MSYKAFISYSHAADGQLAPSIQAALQRFAKPWYRPRALRVFRDKSSLSASPGLWPSIERALADSEFFLLFASPTSAASKWVKQEIHWWLENRSPDKILILLTDGELAWDPDASDFDWSQTTAITRDLSKRFPYEPLFVDLRWAKAVDSLSLRHSQFRAAMLDIAAPLHGRPKDELDGEDVRQHRRTRIISAAAVTVILLFAVTAAWQANQAIRARDAEAEQRKIAEDNVVEATKQRDIATGQTALAERRQKEAEVQRAEAERQRDFATANSLRVEAERLSTLDDQWDLATLLATESLRRSTNPGTYDLLSRLFTRRGLPTARITTKGGQSTVAFSPDGKLVATADYDGLIVFDAVGSRERLRSASSDLIRIIRFTPSGRRIVIAADSSIRLLEFPSGRVQAELRQGLENAVLRFSGDGRYFVHAHGASVSVRETETLRELGGFEHSTPVGTAAVANDGLFTAVASGRDAVLVRFAGNKRLMLSLPGEAEAISFSPDLEFVAFDAPGRMALPAVFKTSDGTPAPDMAQPALTWLGPARWYRLTRNAEARNVQVFNRRSDVLESFLPYAGLLQKVEWSDDGELLAIGGDERDPITNVYQTSSWRRIAAFKFPNVQISAIAIHRNSNLVATTWARSTIVFRPDHSRPLLRLPELEQPVWVKFSESGENLIARYGPESITYSSPGNSPQRIEINGCRIGSPAALNYSGTRFVITCADGTARVFGARSNEALSVVPHRGTSSPALSQDGRLIFSVTPEGAAVLDSNRGTKVRMIGGDTGIAAFAPGGRAIAVATGSIVRLFQLAGGKPRVIHDETLVESISFSRDGRFLAVGERARFAYVYEVVSGRLVTKLDHKEEDKPVLRIQPVVFSYSGALLATITRDATMIPQMSDYMLHVYDVATGSEVSRTSLSDIPRSIRFSADERAVEVVFGNRSFRVERYPLDSQELIQRACARVGRNLDETEWSRYIPGEPYERICQTTNPALR